LSDLLIETCIELWQDNHGVSERGADTLRSKAGELKGCQSYSDSSRSGCSDTSNGCLLAMCGSPQTGLSDRTDRYKNGC